jgi:hypothetical protein
VVTLPGPPPLAMPDWLAPYPQARNQAKKGTPDEVVVSYFAPGAPAGVIAHYEQHLRSAGVSFDRKEDGNAASLDATLEKFDCTIRVSGQNDGSGVEVRYAKKKAPPPAPRATQETAPLTLEWPEWLQVPRGRVVSQRTNPRGRTWTWSEESCPGDVIGKPSQGCLKKVVQSSLSLQEIYNQLEALLEQHGYTARSQGTGPSANLELRKSISPPFAELKLREYPFPQDPNSFRQLEILMRQPDSPGTRLEMSFLVREAATVAVKPLSGTWAFTHFVGERSVGTITLRQVGSGLAGVWHTQSGKPERDTSVSGQVEGNTVHLIRSMGDLKKEYSLTVSADGDHIEGYGEGRSGERVTLNMERTLTPQSSPAADVGKAAWYEAMPRNRGDWKWAIQSVATRMGSEVKYQNFYYEQSTERTVVDRLALPDGGTIVHAFPVDCAFYVQDERGNYQKFANAQEASGKKIGPGNWTVYPIQVSGVVVYFR